MKSSVMPHPRVAHMAAVLLLGAGVGFAQVTPATPRKFTTRPIGGSTATGGVTVVPAPSAPQKTRYVTHVILSESRPWTSTDGKVLTGNLIGFEDLVVEAMQGATPPPQPTLPAHPTVVRDGKARLLINHKPSEVALDRLSQPDREFIEQVRTTRAKPATQPAATSP